MCAVKFVWRESNFFIMKGKIQIREKKYLAARLILINQDLAKTNLKKCPYNGI